MSKNNQPLDEILYQTIQFTELGNFPESVPKDRNWVNVMGKVYSFDFTLAKSQILTHYIGKQEVLDAIGEDEEYRFEGYDTRGRPKMKRGYPASAIKTRNQLRAEIKKELGLE